MKLAEEKKIVLVASALDLDAADPQTTKGINMKGFHRCTFLIDVGTMGVANATLKVHSGATDGALTSTVAFKYAYGGATSIHGSTGTSSDVLAAETTVVAGTGLVITQATYPNYLLAIEVEATMMDVANGENWLMISFTTGTSTGLVSIFAVLDPRYTKNLSATAL